MSRLNNHRHTRFCKKYSTTQLCQAGKNHFGLSVLVLPFDRYKFENTIKPYSMNNRFTQ